jgi:hypothetical protein
MATRRALGVVVVTFLTFLGAVLAGASSAGCSSCEGKNAANKADAMALYALASDASDDGATGDGGVGAYDDSAMPASSGEDLQTRMRHLLEALSQNNPDLAGDALFPRDGYVAAKDVADPPKDWTQHVHERFRHAVERTHKHMKGLEHAKFVSFEIGHSITQLMPRKNDFKKPLWRVKHSKLTFTIDGKARHLDIAEMTAWRGAWYVTRLRY